MNANYTDDCRLLQNDLFRDTRYFKKTYDWVRYAVKAALFARCVFPSPKNACAAATCQWLPRGRLACSLGDMTMPGVKRRESKEVRDYCIKLNFAQFGTIAGIVDGMRAALRSSGFKL